MRSVVWGGRGLKRNTTKSFAGGPNAPFNSWEVNCAGEKCAWWATLRLLFGPLNVGSRLLVPYLARLVTTQNCGDYTCVIAWWTSTRTRIGCNYVGSNTICWLMKIAWLFIIESKWRTRFWWIASALDESGVIALGSVLPWSVTLLCVINNYN